MCGKSEEMVVKRMVTCVWITAKNTLSIVSNEHFFINRINPKDFTLKHSFQNLHKFHESKQNIVIYLPFHTDYQYMLPLNFFMKKELFLMFLT